MDAFLSALMAMGILVLLVCMIYLLDRVNNLEKLTRQFSQSQKSQKEAVSVLPFAGLSSKKLWDAMTGRVPDGVDPVLVDELRPLYEMVLHKHVDSTFQDGARDGRVGVLTEPKNTKLINTSRGPVDSWLPSAQVNTLYQCGVDSTQLPADQLDSVRLALDEAGQTLYGKAMVNLAQPLSLSLMPPPEADVPSLAPPLAP
jgi:hypothetical protein